MAATVDRVVVAATANEDAITKPSIRLVLSQMGGANHLAQFFCRTMSLRVEGEAISPNSRWRYELINFMSNNFIIRDYRAEDFDSVTSLWRISREKSLPDFQLEKGHFFYEDCNYFRQNVLIENQIWWWM